MFHKGLARIEKAGKAGLQTAVKTALEGDLSQLKEMVCNSVKIFFFNCNYWLDMHDFSKVLNRKEQLSVLMPKKILVTKI